MMVRWLPLVKGAALVSCLVAAGCAGAPADPAAAQSPARAPLATSDADPLVAPGDSITDRLTDADPAAPVAGAPYRVYRVALEEDDVLYAVADSAHFTPTVSLFGPDASLLSSSRRGAGGQGSPAGGMGDLHAAAALGGMAGMAASPGAGDEQNKSAIAQADRDGEYLLVVSSESPSARGSFHLETELASAARTDFELFSHATGFVHEGGSLDPATRNPGDLHTFAIDEPTIVSAKVTSSDFAPHVSFVDAKTGAVVARSQHHEHYGMHQQGEPRVVASLDAGDYQLAVSSPHRDDLGRYTVQTTRMDVDAPDDFVVGSEFESYIGLASQQIPGLYREGEPMSFEVEEESLLAATLHAGEAGTQLVLTDGSGQAVVEGAAPMHGQAARIVAPVEPGSYTLWVASYGGQGRYTLSTEFREPIDGVSELTVGETITSVLTSASETHPTRGTHVEYFDLEIDDRVAVGIDMRSTSLDAYLVLESADGHVIEENDDAAPGTTDARIETSLDPGSYRVGATTFQAGETGDYEVSVEATESR